MDSTAVVNLFNNLWNSAVHKDTIITNHWYSFYDDAFNKLIATHVGLFTALIAVSIALFALKYWLDNKKFINEFDNRIKDKLKDANNSINDVKKNSLSAIYYSYISSIKLVLKLDEERKCTSIILGLVNAILGLDFQNNNETVKILFNEIPQILDRLSNEKDSEKIKDDASPLLTALNKAISEDDSLTAFINSDLLKDLSQKYCIIPPAPKEKKHKNCLLKRILFSRIILGPEFD